MKPLLAIAISGLLLTGCSKSVDSKSKSFTFPLALGNQWTYSVVATREYGDPIKVDTGWTISDTVILTVTQVDTIRPGVFSYTMSAIDVGLEMIDGPPERTYMNLPQGMYLLSMNTVWYYWHAGHLLLRRVPQSPGANSGDEPSAQPSNSHWLTAALPDPAGLVDCQAADPADTLPLVLAYPQRTGLFWPYRDSSAARPYWTYKMIEGRETITTPAGTFDCWRIRFIVTPSGGGDYVDYVSPEGLIRRRIANGSLKDHDISVLTCDLISYTLH
jgi:hypothetical protein